MSVAFALRPSEDVCTALSDAGVPFVVLNEAPRQVTGMVEVDVLTGESWLQEIGDALRHRGFRQIRAAGHEPHHFFALLHTDTGTWTKVDIVTDLRFGRKRDLSAGILIDCLDSRRLNDGIPVPAPECRLVKRLLSAVLNRGEVTLDDIGYFSRQLAVVSAEQRENDAARWFDRHFAPALHWCELVSFTNGLDYSALISRREDLARRLWKGDPRGTIRRWFRRNRGRILRPFSGEGGVTVAIAAPDGAGKSTLAGELCADPVLRARVMKVPTTGGRGSRWMGLVSACLKARWHHACGRLVVWDRHRLDWHAQREGDEPRGLKYAMLSRLWPEVDLVLHLDAPAAVLEARKRHPQEWLEAQSVRFRRLCATLPNARTIDATQPVEVVSARAKSLIWDVYAA